jgi:hypothetical protein
VQPFDGVRGPFRHQVPLATRTCIAWVKERSCHQHATAAWACAYARTQCHVWEAQEGSHADMQTLHWLLRRTELQCMYTPVLKECR